MAVAEQAESMGNNSMGEAALDMDHHRQLGDRQLWDWDHHQRGHHPGVNERILIGLFVINLQATTDTDMASKHPPKPCQSIAYTAMAR